MIRVETITLPAAWASALVNGDFSGLDNMERQRCERYVAELANDGWHVIDVARDDDGEGLESRFTWSFNLYGGDCQGGDVLDYIAHVREARP